MPDAESPFADADNNGIMSDHQGDAPLTLAEYQAIAEVIAADGRRQVLDWGCGYGYVAKYLADLGVDVTLFDYVPTVGDTPIETPLSTFPQFQATVSADPVKLPYADDSFDGVLSLGTLEHVAFPLDSLAELKRVLRPGGLLYVYKLPNPTSYVEYLAKKRGMYYHGLWEHDRTYTLRHGRDMLESAGFGILREGYRNMFPLKQTGRVVPRQHHAKVRAVSDVLSSIPVLRRLATNVEFVCVNLD